MALQCLVEQKAFCKLVGHACKHPSTAVLGLLLGRLDGKSVLVTDSIPVVHRHHELSFTTQAALIQVGEGLGFLKCVR